MDYILLILGFLGGRWFSRLVGEVFNALILSLLGFRLFLITYGEKSWTRVDKGWVKSKTEKQFRPFEITMLPKSMGGYKPKKVVSAILGSLAATCLGVLMYDPTDPHISFFRGFDVAMIGSLILDFLPFSSAAGFKRLQNINLNPQELERNIALQIVLSRIVRAEYDPPHELLEKACSLPDGSFSHAKALFFRSSYHSENAKWAEAWADLQAAMFIVDNPEHGLYYMIRGDAALVAAYGLQDWGEAKRLLLDLSPDRISAHGLSPATRLLAKATVDLHYGWFEEAESALAGAKAEIQTFARAAGRLEDMLVYRVYADLLNRLNQQKRSMSSAVQQASLSE